MKPILLVCTVGSAPEQVVASILACDPSRVVFLCSPGSRQSLHTQPGDPAKGGVLEMLDSHGKQYDSGRLEVVELPSAQDLEGCVEAIHRSVTPEVERWIARGGEHRVTVDFTGGTKPMTLALGLMARVWPCRLQYVGGTERTKDGLGVVVSGREKIVHFQDPWNSLGYQLLDDLRVVFDSGNYGGAAALAAEARNRISSGPLKGAVATLVYFLEGYANWDRFDHRAALRSFASFDAQRNLLVQLVSLHSIELLAAAAARARQFLGAMGERAVPSRAFVVDLLANAQRRLRECRYDDSVARSYRAIEAAAQWLLAERHSIASTAKVAIESLPLELRAEWSPKAEDGFLKLGLQDAYRLLEVLGDPVGKRFRQSGLPVALSARNASYSGHGFQPAPPEVAQRLISEALLLLDATSADLPEFPQLRKLVG